MRQWEEETYVSPVQFGVVFAYGHQPDRALGFLEDALMRRDSQLLFIHQMPAFRRYHGEPRFQNILSSIGLQLNQPGEPQN